MRYLIIIILFFSGMISCISEENVVITKKIIKYGLYEKTEKIIEEKININTEKLILRNHRDTEVHEINGIENLKNVKLLLIGHGLYDLAFLEHMKNLEIVVLKSIIPPVNLAFLTKLPKLKILYINGMAIIEANIDLKNNKSLEFIYLANIRLKNNYNNDYINLHIQNIPDSLEYVDLSLADYVIINNELINNIKKVPNIIITKGPNIFNRIELTKDQLNQNKNIKVLDELSFPDDILPEKYQTNTILGLFSEL